MTHRKLIDRIESNNYPRMSKKRVFMKKCFSILKKIGLGLIALLVLLACTGVLYQSISTKLDEKSYPAPGTLVDVGGYRLHMLSMGTGGPTVILDAGLGNMGADWELVQPEIAKFTQVVSYDRAGNGWSEASPHPRTSQQIVKELHALLENGNVPKPYILVGHSFGGGNVQLYAATYPDEVAGIVLVDSCHEDQWKWLKPQMEAMPKPLPARILSALGISRLMTKAQAEKMAPLLSEEMKNIHLALSSTTKNTCTVCREARSLGESLEQLKKINDSLSHALPCYVISAGIKMDVTQLGWPEEQVRIFNEMMAAWDGLQKDIASKYPGSHFLVAEKSDHLIPWNQPEIIVQAVQELVRDYKQESAR